MHRCPNVPMWDGPCAEPFAKPNHLMGRSAVQDSAERAGLGNMLELVRIARAAPRQLQPGSTGWLAANSNTTQRRPQKCMALTVLLFALRVTRAAAEDAPCRLTHSKRTS